jgi:hypothetical protein
LNKVGDLPDGGSIGNQFFHAKTGDKKKAKLLNDLTT